MTRSAAIRAKCLDCSNNQPREILLCTIPSCALYPFRLGYAGKKRYERAEVLKQERRE